MKVLVISTVNFGFNGIVSVIMNYYSAMSKQGYQIDFVSIDDDMEEKFKSIIEQSGGHVYVIHRTMKGLAKYCAQLRKVVRREGYDVVHVHGNSALMFFDLFASWLGGAKVRIAHSHNTTCSHMVMHHLLYPFFKMSYNRAIACGEKAGEWLFHKSQFQILKNGIDVEKYLYDKEVREQVRKKYGIRNEKVIGHVGIFNYQKNHRYLLSVFREIVSTHKDYRLMLVGDGELFDQMKQLVINYGIESYVIFVGKTNRVEEYLQAMDLFALPSHFEGLPVVLVEAQASGLPCVVSDEVTKEADLCGMMQFAPIDDSLREWIVDLEEPIRGDRELLSHENIKQLTKRGYNIKENMKVLEKIYLGKE